EVFEGKFHFLLVDAIFVVHGFEIAHDKGKYGPCEGFEALSIFKQFAMHSHELVAIVVLEPDEGWHLRDISVKYNQHLVHRIIANSPSLITFGRLYSCSFEAVKNTKVKFLRLICTLV